MPQLRAGTYSADADAVVFDKDGTLIDFHAAWAPRVLAWARLLAVHAGAPRLVQELASALGFEPDRGNVLPESPLAVAPTAELQKLATAVVVRYVGSSQLARHLTVDAFRRTTPGPVVPRGDVRGALRRMATAGFKLGVATTDDRYETVSALGALGVINLIDGLVCGDDGVPPKPDPAVLQALGRTIGVVPARMLMVGDTLVDVETGRSAGVQGCLAVTGGAGDVDQLLEFADVVVGSVDEFQVLPKADDSGSGVRNQSA